MNLENVKREDWILGGLALLLIIDLVALPWFSIGGGSVGGISIPSVDFSATDAPDGWLGILAVIAALALIADLAVEQFSPQTQVPAIGGSRGMTRFILAAAAAGFCALKFLFHIHFSLFGFGFWAAVVLAAALVYFAMQGRTTVPSRPTANVGPGAGTGGAGGGGGGGTAGGPPSSSPPPTTP